MTLVWTGSGLGCSKGGAEAGSVVHRDAVERVTEWVWGRVVVKAVAPNLRKGNKSWVNKTKKRCEMREIPLDKIKPGPVRRNTSMRADIMQPSELATVPARLKRIARRANEPLSESEIVLIEEAHKVVLPPDYRFYLRFVGNGWAGPDFGICRLGTWDDDRPWSGDDWVWLVGKLAEPFPHVDAWNPAPFDPAKS